MPYTLFAKAVLEDKPQFLIASVAASAALGYGMTGAGEAPISLGLNIERAGSFGLSKEAALDLAATFGKTPEQTQKILSAIRRATRSSTIDILKTEGDDVIVNVTRAGKEGEQVLESRIAPDGTKKVVQKAFDSKGKLVHYDPKTQ